MAKKRTVKINDLNVDIAELQKKDPQILKKIRGGTYFSQRSMSLSSFTLACGSDYIPCGETKTLLCQFRKPGTI